MNRRAFLTIILPAVCSVAEAGGKGRMRFAFRVKTKRGSTVGNVVIEAKDVEAAKVKLSRRYPNCTILNVEIK